MWQRFSLPAHQWWLQILRQILSKWSQACVVLLYRMGFTLVHYYGFELNPRNGCTLAQRVSSKSYTRFKNCCINSTIRSIILECCTNVTQMGPLYLSRIKCTLVGMHSGLQHKSKPLTPIRSGTQQHYHSRWGAYCGINVTLQQYFYKTTRNILCSPFTFAQLRAYTIVRL